MFLRRKSQFRGLSQSAFFGLLLCFGVLGPGLGIAQEAQEADEAASKSALEQEKFEAQSVAYRTALYHDPSLESSLEKLVELYRKADQTAELVQVYKTHVAQFPQDPGGRVVLIRLLRALNDSEAQALTRKAAKDFPKNALVAYLAYESLERERDPKALDLLSQAIDLEVQPGRRQAWVDRLVARAISEDRRDLAERHLKGLAEAPGQTARGLLQAAGKMHKARFHEMALEVLGKALAMNTDPELGVEIEMAAAKSESSMKKYEEAGQRLDALLKRVAPDYWRRSEIVSLRVNLLRTDASREAMLKTAKEAYSANPKLESAALDYAELLMASELRRDALKVLLEAGERLPSSDRIEKQTIRLFDRLGDDAGALDYLGKRLEEQPGRVDLAYRRVKALYMTGKTKDASAAFDSLSLSLTEAERGTQALELARYLRRMSLPGESAKIFEKLVKESPDRLDLRRELAEVHAAVGNRVRARQLFDAELAEGATIENFLDVVQYMVQEDILVEARKALKTRLESSPNHLELRMLLVEVHGKMGEQQEGGELLESTRLLADTPARYRRWLEAGARFHEGFGGAASFLETERATLVDSDEGKWTTRKLERFLAFCEQAEQGEDRSMVVTILTERLGDPDLPAEMRPRLRRRLIDLFRADPARAGELQVHLEALLEEDGERQDGYRLQMAQIHHLAGRSDKARELLQKVEFEKVQDASQLKGVHALFLNYSMTSEALAVLERMTELEPSDRGNWQSWLAVLAAMGEEGQLRFGLRRLLAGVDRMPLSDGTYRLLRGHLADSYWRSIAKILADSEPDYGEVFPLLEAIERGRGEEDDLLWAAWTRAWVLGKQGRVVARDEAIGMLLQAGRVPADAEEGDEPAKRIYFPDGLVVSLDAAVEALKEPLGDEPVVAQGKAVGPVGELEIAWGFEAGTIVQVLPVQGRGILVEDTSGWLNLVDRESGKLLWRRARSSYGQVIATGRAQPVPSYYTARSSGSASRFHPRCVVSEDGERLFLQIRHEVLCLGFDDGAVRWRAELESGDDGRHQVKRPVMLFLDEGLLLAYDAAGSAAFGFEERSGKLRWERELPPEVRSPSSGQVVTDNGAGASCSNGYFFVHGRASAILRAQTGEILWSFEAGKVRAFPIQLVSPEEKGSGFLGVGSLGGGGIPGRVDPAAITSPLELIICRREVTGAAMRGTFRGIVAAWWHPR